MIVNKETVYTRDTDNKKINVVREFDAPVSKVWKAWTDPELLDQWWAPKPWKTNTVSMDFREGGRWFYYMQGPDNSRHYCLVDYKTITPQKQYTGLDAFADDKGNLSTDMPRMSWKVDFKNQGETTKVEVDVSFDNIEDLEKIIEMGFKEGFAMAHGNLDELLETM